MLEFRFFFGQMFPLTKPTHVGIPVFCCHCQTFVSMPSVFSRLRRGGGGCLHQVLPSAGKVSAPRWRPHPGDRRLRRNSAGRHVESPRNMFHFTVASVYGFLSVKQMRARGQGCVSKFRTGRLPGTSNTNLAWQSMWSGPQRSSGFGLFMETGVMRAIHSTQRRPSQQRYSLTALYIRIVSVSGSASANQGPNRGMARRVVTVNRSFPGPKTGSPF